MLTSMAMIGQHQQSIATETIVAYIDNALKKFEEWMRGQPSGCGPELLLAVPIIVGLVYLIFFHTP